jgi:hypothetical protein
MRKVAMTVIIALAITAMNLIGAGLSSEATATSTMLLAAAKASTTQVWTANKAYAQGELVIHNSVIWFALVAGTSGSTGPEGINDSLDGTVTWRKVLTQTRNGLVICNEGPSPVTISWFSNVKKQEGMTLPEGGKIILTAEDVIQSAVYIITDSGTATVAILEW